MHGHKGSNRSSLSMATPINRHRYDSQLSIFYLLHAAFKSNRNIKLLIYRNLCLSLVSLRCIKLRVSVHTDKRTDKQTHRETNMAQWKRIVILGKNSKNLSGLPVFLLQVFFIGTKLIIYHNQKVYKTNKANCKLCQKTSKLKAKWFKLIRALRAQSLVLQKSLSGSNLLIAA